MGAARPEWLEAAVSNAEAALGAVERAVAAADWAGAAAADAALRGALEPVAAGAMRLGPLDAEGVRPRLRRVLERHARLASELEQAREDVAATLAAARKAHRGARNYLETAAQ